MNIPPLRLRFRVRSAFQQLRVEAPAGHSLEQLCLPAWSATTSVIVRVLIWSCGEQLRILFEVFCSMTSRFVWCVMEQGNIHRNISALSLPHYVIECYRSLQQLHELPLLIAITNTIYLFKYKFDGRNSWRLEVASTDLLRLWPSWNGFALRCRWKYILYVAPCEQRPQCASCK